MKHKHIDDPFYARLQEAEDAGLNKEWALKVAYMEVTLDEALGDMDMDAESELDPNFVICDDEPEAGETESLDCWMCDGKVVCDCGYWEV